MKLFKSIKPLQTMLESKLTVSTYCKLTSHIITLKQGKSIQDYKTRFRFNLWHSLSKLERDSIIEASIPKSDWIGGYPDIKDSHIETLLKKVIDLRFIINVETGLILNARKLLAN